MVATGSRVRSPRPGVRAWVALVVLAALGVGCLGGRSEPPQYWVLTAMEGKAIDPSKEFALVGIGPIELPASLRRPEVILRGEANEVDISGRHLWAEAFPAGVKRVLGENLEALVENARPIYFPWKGPVRPDYQVLVAVSRFDARLEGAVELRAAWGITRAGERTTIARGSSNISAPVESDEVGDAVAAMSLALEQLSRDIAPLLVRVIAEDSKEPVAQAEP